MKVFLSIFCALMALFGGGCALMLGTHMGPLVLLPLAVLLLNGLVLAALWGWRKPFKPAFYVLATADLLIAGGLALATLFTALNDATVLGWGLATIAAFAAKGIATIMVARKDVA